MTEGQKRLARGYMLSIFIDGSRTFAATSVTYHEPIKQCAAGLLVPEQLEAARAPGGKVTEDEYNETMAYVGTPEAEAWKAL